MAKPIHISDSTFDAEVLKSDIPVLTDFWAEWCVPCRAIAPALREIAGDYDGRLKIAKLHVDKNPQKALEYGIQSIPTLILFKNGQPVDRLVGGIPKGRLVSRIRFHLS